MEEFNAVVSSEIGMTQRFRGEWELGKLNLYKVVIAQTCPNLPFGVARKLQRYTPELFSR